VGDVGFTIGRLSADTGVNIETIRYYERIGLVPRAPRSAAGRRLYDSYAVRRLGFIRRARELGFSLDDIRFLAAFEDSRPTCAEVHTLASRHLQEIRLRIRDLKRLERRLSTVTATCSRAAVPDCPLIDTLSNGSAKRPRHVSTSGMGANSPTDC
jgi:MerR family transcriptional regulator, mercuric resistance operon regulatory protein